MQEDHSTLWRNALVPADATLQQVIRNLDDSSLQISLVISPDEVLVGTITDGDIRRGLLQGLDMNSSSGLAEAPTFKIGTINIGDRQKGRMQADSIINCIPIKKSIMEAFKELYLKEFQDGLKNVHNPYGDGCASKKIVKKLKKMKLNDVLKKSFYDVKNI